MERRPGTAAAGLLATKPLDPTTPAYLELWLAYTSEDICALMAVRSNTFNIPPSSYPRAPEPHRYFALNMETLGLQLQKHGKGHKFPRLSRSSMCSKHIFSSPTCPFLHSGCPYSRAVSRAHTLDSCTPPGCRILQSGITPGWGSCVITILAFFFYRVVPEPPLVSKPELSGALSAHANLPSPGPGPPILQGNSVKPTNGH